MTDWAHQAGSRRGAAEADALGSFAAMLWQERECLERLLFTLVSQQLLLQAGHARWLNLSDDDLRAAATAVRQCEVLRAAEFEMLARNTGLPIETTLHELAELVPEPWPMVFDEHRTVLRTLALEIQSVAAENTRLLRAGANAVRETLENLRGGREGYDARGGAAGGRASVSLLDEQA